MKVEFKPVGVIKARLGIQQYGPTHKYFAERCRQRMNARYVPRDEENLINSSFVDNTCNIVYPQTYAHYQYRGIVYIDPVTGSTWGRKGERKIPTDRMIKNYTTSGTGPYWDKKMVSAELDEVIKETKEFMKRGGK